MRVLLALGISFVAATAIAAPVVGHVTRVIDGDTFAIGSIRIRLCGIDAPEIGDRGHEAATGALTALASEGVRCIPVGEGAICDGRSKPTNHGRIVAQCFSGDVDLAGEMVRLGHACDWVKFSGGAYSRTAGRRC